MINWNMCWLRNFNWTHIGIPCRWFTEIITQVGPW